MGQNFLKIVNMTPPLLIAFQPILSLLIIGALPQLYGPFLLDNASCGQIFFVFYCMNLKGQKAFYLFVIFLIVDRINLIRSLLMIKYC